MSHSSDGRFSLCLRPVIPTLAQIGFFLCSGGDTFLGLDVLVRSTDHPIFIVFCYIHMSPKEPSMKAIRFHEFGGPEVLKYEDVPDPRPRKDQVLVRVKACALNHLDLFIRKGLPGVKLPHINGSDVAGIVAEVGEYITDLKVGQRVLLAPHVFCGVCAACSRGEQNFCLQYTVLGYLNDGGNAEFIAVPRVNVLPIQGELTYDEAAAVPLVFLTAWHMLVGRA